ncbi:MAG: MATE family efflux transporter, partial [Oscillospiraceae bacterium]
MYKNNYEQSSLHRLVLLFGIPSILSLMMEMLTGIVDTAFAGNLPTGGSDALSAMALISPVLGIFTALQTLFAMSTGILISRYQNDPRRRNDCYLAGVVMTVAVSLTASLICGWQLPNLLTALGATGSIFTSAKQYLQIQLLSNICSSIGYTLTCCIRAFGFPKSEVRIVACSVVTNILFNYIFAFVCDRGISGLAWGTFVSEAVCMGLSAGFLIRKKYRFSTSSLTARTFFRDTR